MARGMLGTPPCWMVCRMSVTASPERATSEPSEKSTIIKVAKAWAVATRAPPCRSSSRSVRSMGSTGARRRNANARRPDRAEPVCGGIRGERVGTAVMRSTFHSERLGRSGTCMPSPRGWCGTRDAREVLALAAVGGCCLLLGNLLRFSGLGRTPLDHLARPLLQLGFQLRGPLGVALGTELALPSLVSGAHLLDDILQCRGAAAGERGHRVAGEDDEGVELGLLLADLHCLAPRAIGLAFLMHEGTGGQPGAEGLHQLPRLDPGIELLLAGRLGVLAEAELDGVAAFIGGRLEGHLQAFLDAVAFGLGLIEDGGGNGGVVVNGADEVEHGMVPFVEGRGVPLASARRWIGSRGRRRPAPQLG